MLPTRAMPRAIGVSGLVKRRRREPDEGCGSRVVEFAVEGGGGRSVLGRREGFGGGASASGATSSSVGGDGEGE